MKKILLLLIAALISSSVFTQTYPNKIGIGLSGIGGFGMEFTDAAKTMRSFDNTSVDADGNPEHNFNIVVFDMRPCCPWIGSVDDPFKFVPELMSGLYKISFNGKATIASNGDPVLLQNQTYNETDNITTLDMIVQRDKWLVILNFTNTQRTSASDANTGITNFRLLRPGYHNKPDVVFRQEYLNAISHFPVIRFMDFVSTNGNNKTYPAKTEWDDRVLPSDALFKDIAPWEYVIEMANLTGKDIWINIPAAASDDYINQLATLLKNGLTNPDCKIYIEYSNEVWNGGFEQFKYNKDFAIAEVNTEKAGGVATLLNDEAGECDKNDDFLWAGRRHIRRLKEIGDIFVETFSPGNRISFETKIRPVFAWQIGGWIPYYSCILKWFEFNYGPSKDYFYGLAGAAYVNAEGATSNANVAAILSKMLANSDAGRGSKRDNPTSWTTGSGKKGLKEIADIFKIRMLQYEMGPDNGGGDAANIANRIAANRNANMKDVIVHDLKDNWFADPDIAGDLSMYFVLCSSFTRYGSWGATEEVENMHTSKLQALYELAGITEDKSGPSTPGNIQKSMDGNDAIISWEVATDNVAVTHYSISDKTGALATVLSSEPLTVRLKNYTASLNDLKVEAVDAFNNVSGFLLSNSELSRQKQKSQVYPNPVKDTDLNIKLTQNSKNSEISLINIQGQILTNIKSGQRDLIQINSSKLVPGMYFLVIENDKSCEIVKVMKE